MENMNLKTTVDGKEVTIILTKEQLNEIKKQTEKPFDYNKISRKPIVFNHWMN